MAFVYILKSVDHSKTYTGSTTDLKRRIREHNSGKSGFSSRFKPWVLVYKEYYVLLDKARQREKYFKSAAGRKYIKKNNIIPR